MALTTITCSSVSVDRCCVAASTLPPFRTIEIVGVASSLHGRPVSHDPGLLAQLKRTLEQQFPNIPIVKSGGDLQIIFVMVDYVPGCLPHCRKFPTYRNWTGEVMTWIPKPGTNMVSGTQIVAFTGSSYSPFTNHVTTFVSRFKRYWFTERRSNDAARSPSGRPTPKSGDVGHIGQLHDKHTRSG